MNEQRYLDAVREIAGKIRYMTDAPIVLGGSAFSIMPEAILNEVGADYGIVGEGESLMVQFADNAAKGMYPEKGCIRSSNHMKGQDIPSAMLRS